MQNIYDPSHTVDSRSGTNLWTIVEYLEEKWSETQVQKFIRRVNHVIKQISEFPFIFKASILNNNLRKGFVARQCSLFYEVGQDEIVLLFFWDNRRRPLLANN